jgi:hypothetical protein
MIEFHLKEYIVCVHIIGHYYLSNQLQGIHSVIKYLRSPLGLRDLVGHRRLGENVKQKVNLGSRQTNTIHNASDVQIWSPHRLLNEPVRCSQESFESARRRILLNEHPFSNLPNHLGLAVQRPREGDVNSEFSLKLFESNHISPFVALAG